MSGVNYSLRSGVLIVARHINHSQVREVINERIAEVAATAADEETE